MLESPKSQLYFFIVPTSDILADALNETTNFATVYVKVATGKFCGTLTVYVFLVLDTPLLSVTVKPIVYVPAVV